VTAVANQIDTQDTAQRESIRARNSRYSRPNSHSCREPYGFAGSVRDNAGSCTSRARVRETQYLWTDSKSAIR